MEIIRIIITRKKNIRLLLILVLISLCSLVALVLYQLLHSPSSHTKTWPVGQAKYDLHSDQFDSEGDDAFHLRKEVEDPVVIDSRPQHSHLSSNSSSRWSKSIAIGCAITSHTEEHLSLENVAYKLPFLRTLVPSFCKTASVGYEYHFYAAFDIRDPHLSKKEFMEAINDRFQEVIGLLCPKKSKVFMHFVQCSHNRNPTWAQNDAMIEAYLDDIEYYYRVNDDTLMLTPGWTEAYIEGLQGFSPPNIGVVGPLHKGGNEAILTYDFVHRNHIDIFGYYYPRVFTDWWADNWITQVYGETRTLKLPNVRLIHTGEAGTRYEVKQGKQRFLEEQIKEDQQSLQRYLAALEDSNSRKSVIKKVVSMSLWGSQTRYTFGALRNAQLIPVYFPGWTLRIYMEKPRDDETTIFSPVPERIVSKLAKLGAEIMRVDAERSHIPPMMWRFLVADDISVDIFIVRDSDCRLQDRDATVVRDWIASKAAFHCIRDHPSHAQYSLLGGLWGGMPRKLHEILPIPWQELMMGARSEYSQDMAFLASAIWPKVQNHAFCHDSVSCKKWVNSFPFPLERIGTEHLGQVFDAFGNARDEDIQILLENRPTSECTVQQRNPLEIVSVKSTRMPQSNGSSVDYLKTNGPSFFNTSSGNDSANFLRRKGIIKTRQNENLQINYLHRTKVTSDTSDLRTYENRSSFVSIPLPNRLTHRASNGNIPNIYSHKQIPTEELKKIQNSHTDQAAPEQNSLTARKLVDHDKLTSDTNISMSHASLNRFRSSGNSSALGSVPTAVVWSMAYSIFPVRAIKHLTSIYGVRFVDKSLASGCQETHSCAHNLRVVTKKNGMSLTEDVIHAFYKEYQSDPEMDLVSHFLCTYPPSLCELYTKFNRPLVIYITSRYEHGKYTAAEWLQWNALLKNLAGKTSNRILAGSVYDARYLKYFTDIEATVIPPHCGYLGVTYNPTSTAVLLSATKFPSFDEFFLYSFERAVGNSSLKFKILSSSDISFEYAAVVASHYAIIHVPSDVVTENFCEHYGMHIPIFIPTVNLTIAWHFTYDILSQLTWNSVRQLKGEGADGSPLPSATGMEDIPDPNANHNRVSLEYWLKLSAFYQSPHLIYFSSFKDLVTKLHQTNLKEVSLKMAQEDAEMRVTAAKEWLKVLQSR